MYQDHSIGVAGDHSCKLRHASGYKDTEVLGVLWYRAARFGVRCEAWPVRFGWKLAEPGDRVCRDRRYLAVEPNGRAYRGEPEGER